MVLRARLLSDQHGALAWGGAWDQCDLARLDAVLLGPGLGMVQGCWRQWAEPLLGFSGLLVLEGRPGDIKSKLEAEWWTTTKGNWALWIPAQVVNFRLVPAQFQVLFANVVGVAWNIFLSYRSFLPASSSS